MQYDTLGLFGDGKKAKEEYLKTHMKCIAYITTPNGHVICTKERPYTKDEILRIVDNTPLGHSDFLGGDEFDFTWPDNAFWTDPLTPWGIWKHFQDRNFVYRPITRLDRDTSGVCLIAKNKFSAAIFSEHIAKNLIKRSYLGVVKGNVYNTLHINPNLQSINHLDNMTDLEIVVDSPIKRVDDSTIERCVAADGEVAITKIFALKFIDKLDVSLCKFILLTGRTHQIRVHMKHIGFPIIGDFLYNPDYSLINRQALHSSELLMNHPITHEMMRFDAKIPDDINEIIR